MRIVHISDTHNQHHKLKNLPPADLIIHSGDVSMAAEENDFIEWFCKLDYEYKIFIAGNHDYHLYEGELKVIQSYLPTNCYYLCYSGIELNGVKFWGVPYSLEDDLVLPTLKRMEEIPIDIDILISHRPPYGILDTSNYSYGCPQLLSTIQKRLKLSYHLFGHVHSAYGIIKKYKTTFINAALTDPNYNLIKEPIIFEI